MIRRGSRATAVAWVVVASILQLPGDSAQAQDGWNPFLEPGNSPWRQSRPNKAASDLPRPPLAPMDGPRTRPGELPAGRPQPDLEPPQIDRGRDRFAPREAVEQTELPPLDAPGSGGEAPERAAVPNRDSSRLASALSDLALPIRSAAFAQILVRLIGPDGLWQTATAEESAARADALYRSGRTREAAAVLTRAATEQPS